MKKTLLLILLSVSLFSCSNYKKAEELYLKGIEEKSTSILIQAHLKIKKAKVNNGDDENIQLLQNKIDSVLNKIKKEEAILANQKKQELKLKRYQKIREEFISNAVGKSIWSGSYDIGVAVSELENLNKKEVGDFTYWINYYKKLDVTILSNMRTGIIIEVFPGYNPYSELKQ